MSANGGSVLVVDGSGGPRLLDYLPRLQHDFDVSVLAFRTARETQQAFDERAEVLRARGAEVETASSLAEVEDRAFAWFQQEHRPGYLALSERTVHAAQRAAFRAGRYANDPATIERLRNKRLQRVAMGAAGLPVPKQTSIDGTSELVEFSYPAVLKPSIGMGSLATIRVSHASQLRAAIVHAKALIEIDDRTRGSGAELLLEEELIGDPARTFDGTRGDYVSVDLLFSRHNEPVVLAVQDKLPLAAGFRENGHLMPTVRNAVEQKEIVDMALAANAALGVTFGATHTELKLTVDGPRIVEVNARPGGGLSEMLTLAAGYDLPLELSRTSIDAEYVPSEPHFARFAGRLTPQPPPGEWTVSGAPTQEEVSRFRSVERVEFVAQAGESLDSSLGTSSRLASVYATGADQEDLIRLAYSLGASGGAFLLEPGNTPMASTGRSS